MTTTNKTTKKEMKNDTINNRFNCNNYSSSSISKLWNNNITLTNNKQERGITMTWKQIYEKNMEKYGNQITWAKVDEKLGDITYHIGDKEPSLRMLKDLVGDDIKIIDFEPDCIDGSQIVVNKNMSSIPKLLNKYASEEVSRNIVGNAVILYDQATLDYETYDWLF